MGCYANKKETIGKGGPLKVVYRQNLTRQTLPNAAPPWPSSSPVPPRASNTVHDRPGRSPSTRSPSCSRAGACALHKKPRCRPFPDQGGQIRWREGQSGRGG